MKGIDFSGAFNAASKINGLRHILTIGWKAGVKLERALLAKGAGNKATPVSACFAWATAPNAL
jgi:hypothetical protein